MDIFIKFISLATVTIGSRSQEEINITDDSLLYSETNKTNGEQIFALY